MSLKAYMRHISITSDRQTRTPTIFLKLELTTANLIFGSSVLKSGILFKTTSNQRAALALRLPFTLERIKISKLRFSQNINLHSGISSVRRGGKWSKTNTIYLSYIKAVQLKFFMVKII